MPLDSRVEANRIQSSVLYWDAGANKAVDKHYGSKYDKAKTEKCHTFVEALVPNGAERVKKVVQTLY